MSKMQFAFGQMCVVAQGNIVLTLVGPRGGLAFSGELTLAEALMLRERLDDAIAAVVKGEREDAA